MSNKMEVRCHTGYPTLHLNGKPYPPVAYTSYLGTEELYADMAAAGIHLYCFPAYLGERGINIHSGIGPFRPPLWTAENTFDFGSIEQDFDTLLAADPEALVILRIALDPPSWWEAAHPEGCCQLPDGSTLRQCFASESWLNATEEALRTCVRWLLESPYANHLVAIHVAAGGTEEWCYHYHDAYHDLNPERTQAFRQWLRERYGDDALLQSAWEDSSIHIDGAKPANISTPEVPARWRTAPTDTPLLDTLQFQADMLAQAIGRFCHAVKEESEGTLLTGVFYGYHYYLHEPRKGHGALAKVLACPDVDYLASPNAYWRTPGEDWPPMAPVQSVQLHGKLWMAENDTRTCCTTLLKDMAPDICPPGQYDSGVWLGPEDMDTSVAVLWANAARMLAYGYGGWWFDMWGKWFQAPELMAVLERAQTLLATHPPQQMPGMQPEICVILDEATPLHDSSCGALCRELFQTNAKSLGKSGAPYALYLRSDLPRLATIPFKLVWLLGIADLTEEENALLASRQEEGTTLVWTNTNNTRIQKSNATAWEPHADAVSFMPVGLRELWDMAGVHIYCESEDILYAGCGWLAIHSMEGGERTIRLPFHATIFDAINETQLATGTNSFSITLAPRSTRLMHISL